MRKLFANVSVFCLGIMYGHNLSIRVIVKGLEFLVLESVSIPKVLGPFW